jgi:hypothetical protein|tara:strand:- start:157 stop:333 length:177 start_codon:yes stop_codon:yes gene_type:complete
MFKKTVNVKAIIRNPIGVENLQFRRTTSRYKNKGTFSSNKGYLSVSRDASNGQFVARG